MFVRSDRLTALLGIDIPIVQAPMAGAQGPELTAAVSAAGGLGSLPCAMLSLDQVGAAIAAVRERTPRPFSVNFFCHQDPEADPDREARWRARLAPYYRELDLEADAETGPAPRRAPFNDALCAVVMETRPRVVSFHFGLPEPRLVEQVRGAGCVVMSTATTVAEARWLENHGADVVIAQGYEAGGHQGWFLPQRPQDPIGIMALLPQIVDAVDVPVIATGGIADGRGIAAALMLGASAVQIGTAYLLSGDARVSPLYPAALAAAAKRETALTNVFTGRHARGIVNRLMHEVGPTVDDVPAFPLAAATLAPLRAAAEANGSADFTTLWAGQGAALARELPAGELTEQLWADALGTILSMVERFAP